MAKSKASKTSSVETVVLNKWQELGLLVPLVLILALATYNFIHAIYFPLVAGLIAIIIAFCLYSIVTRGRKVYSKVYLTNLTIMTLIIFIVMAPLLAGFVKDMFGVQCTGFFGVPESCVENSAIPVSFMGVIALIPLAGLALVAMAVQMRAPKNIKRR